MLRIKGSVAAVAVAAAVGLATSVAYIPPSLAKGESPPADKCSKHKKGSPEWKKCTGSVRDDMTDQEIFNAGYWLARTGHYADALAILDKAKVRNARVLTYIGFATRKLGNFDAAMGFYGEALSLNPNYTVARAYLGEAWIGKGDVAKAREQLGEIATRCGTTCTDYIELKAEIEKAEVGKS
jgi:tetratricopeptide (TPR) repeat protein